MVFLKTSKVCKRSEKGLFGPGSSEFFRLMNALALKRLIPAAVRVAQKVPFLSHLNLRCLTPVFRSNSEKVASIPER